MQYLAYSQPPTSVSHALKGDFLQPGVPSLLQAKTNRLEIHKIDASGLQLALTASIHGTILTICPVRLRAPEYPTLAVAVLTTTFQLFILSFNNEVIKSVASHSIAERSASSSTDLVALIPQGATAHNDSTEPTKFLVFHGYQGLIRVVLLDEATEKRRTSKAAKDETVDLSRGFTIRIPELLLNSMILLPPAESSAHYRLATIHTNVVGQRVLQIHQLNLANRSLDPEDPDKATSFLPNSGLQLADPDAELMIPISTDRVQGIIVIGQDSARYVQTGRPAASIEEKATPATITEGMAVDEPTPIVSPPGISQRRLSTSQQQKGKGKAKEGPSPSQLATSPGAALPPLATSPSSPSAAIPGAIPMPRRRSSAASQAGAALSPPGLGTKRKLSESATSSGRGKTLPKKDAKPIECSLPVSQYNSYCMLSHDPNRILLVDGWGQALYLCLKVTSRSASISSASGPLSPTSPKSNSRRLSRSSVSSGSSAPSALRVSLTVESITNGRVSSPTCLVDLGDDYVFVGSHYGDSLLAKLPKVQQTVLGAQDMDIEDGNEEAQELQIVSAYTNLAPIVDFTVVETGDGQGPSHIITCSGGRDDGTLRVVRHGVGLTELASLEMEGVQKVWSLSNVLSSASSSTQDLLVLSFINETRILSLNSSEEGSIEEMDSLPGFKLAVPTIAAHLAGDHLVQVTADGVYTSESSWSSSEGSKITLASGCGNYLLLAVGGSHLTLLEVGTNGQLTPVATHTFDNEIACLSLNNILEQGSNGIIASVGLWTVHEAIILSVPALKVLQTVVLDTTYLLRSILAITLATPSADAGAAATDSASSLFVGLGDGSLVSYTLKVQDDVAVDVNSKKVLSLGTRPVTLHSVKTGGNAEDGTSPEPAVFVASDRSTIVSRTGGKLTYASANLKDVTSVSQIASAAYPNSMIYSTTTSLNIGRIDSLQKLHVRTIRLGNEAPRRICYSKSLKAYGVVFLQEVLDRLSGDIYRSSSFKILDEATFGVLFDYPLETQEEARSVHVQSLASSTDDMQVLGDDESFLVGTGYIDPSEPECTRGRVLVFSETQSRDGGRSFSLNGETETRGAVHAITKLEDGRFAISSNHEIIVFSHDAHSRALEHLCSWGGTFIAYSLISKGNLLVAVDPLRAPSMLRYDPESNKLICCAREYSSYGVFSAAFIEDVYEDSAATGESSDSGVQSSTIVVADLDLNVFTAKTSFAAKPVDSSELLAPQALVHLGEVVNKFAPGSLVPSFASAANSAVRPAAVPQLIFATSNGSIGMLASLSPEASKLLSDLERNMAKTLPESIGSLKQPQHRAFKSPHRQSPSLGFIDGTYVEDILNIETKEELDTVMKGASEHESIATPSNEVLRLVEELQRLH